MSGWIYIPDSDGSNNMLRLGNGADLKIYHDGSHSYINESGTGNLRIKSDNAVLFETDNFTVNNEANSENLLIANNGGSVELYYDNSKKFETMSSGTKTNGYHFVSNAGGTAYIRVGQGATDNQYAHLDLVGDTTYNSYGFRILRGNTGPNTTSNIYHRGTGAFYIICQDNAELRFLTNNSTRWRIESGGDLKNASDSYKLRHGASNDIQIYNNGRN